MFEIFGMDSGLLLSQLLIGLVQGCFYALLSLGLAVIFGVLNIVNFAHGAFYMLGAMLAYATLTYFRLSYWWALILCPVVVAAAGMLLERTLLRRLYRLDHLYGLLLTFGVALLLEGAFLNAFGASGQPYRPPPELEGGFDLGFMYLPGYRLWVVGCALALCVLCWFVIERTHMGALLRAGTENSKMLQALGVNVPALVTLTYGAGVALAAIAGVLAAPVTQVSPLMGSNVLIVIFAVVVIGGMGSIAGSVLTGVGLGLIEAVTKVVYPSFSSTVVFLVMVIVLLVRPSGLFGRTT